MLTVLLWLWLFVVADLKQRIWYGVCHMCKFGYLQWYMHASLNQ